MLLEHFKLAFPGKTQRIYKSPHLISNEVIRDHSVGFLFENNGQNEGIFAFGSEHSAMCLVPACEEN